MPAELADMNQVVVYGGQTQRHLVSYAALTVGGDTVARAEAKVSMVSGDDDSILSADVSIVDWTKVAMDLHGFEGEGVFDVELYVETEARRAHAACYRVGVTETPEVREVPLFLKRGEQLAYELSWATSLSPEETITEIVLGPHDSCLFAAAQIYSGESALLVLGVSAECTETEYEVGVTATSSLGHDIIDTLRIIVGACDG